MSKRNVKSMTLILFVILIVLVSLSCVSAQGVSDSSANLTKSQTDGSGGQVSVPSNNAILSSSGDKNFTVLQNEIESSSTGMIQLSSNYIRAPGESNIIISKNFNILGEGYTIDGNNLGVIFTIDQGCSVLLSNVVLVNGNGTNGGAIYNEGTVNIINSALTSNNASFGGAIYNKGVATVTGSTINENTATMGGAIYSEGYLLVGNSNFENNVADLGGAICVNAGATLQINDGRFRNNTVTNGGGAIAIIGDVTYDISASTFDSNKAINTAADACVAGGAIYTEGNAVGTISGSTFTENEANSPLYPNGGAIKVQFGGQATIEDCTFIKNSAGLNGGAINAQAKNGADCFVTVNNCIFTENTAQAGAAISALQNHGKSILSVENSFFTSNTATLIGGAVYVDAFSEAQIIADEFTSNTAGKGGAIYSLSKNLNVEDSNFDANTATMGKAIYNSNGALNLNNNTISKTSADIYSVGGTISPINVTVTINGSDVYAYSASETVTLNATVTDVDGNLINVDNLWFILGDNVVTLPASYVSDGKYSATINPTKDITYVVGAALSPDTGVVYNVETAKLLFIRSFNDLEAAINAISANGVLELNEEYVYDPAVDIYNADPDKDNTNRQYNGIFIFRNLTINGNGHFIDASAINRTFIIYGFTSVTIKNVIFYNGKSNNGSAIYSAGNLKFENCTFINGTTYYDDSDAFSSGSVVQGEATRYIVINDKDSYDAALADPASQLNRYYYAFSREDGVKEDGSPARGGDFVYAHGWESAMTAPTEPTKTSTFPWIIVNGVGFTDDLVFKYNDSVELVDGPVSWSVNVYSVPNDLGMTDYRLVWGTGDPGAKTLDPNEVEVLFCNVEGTYTDLQNYIDNTNPGETLVLPYNFTYNPDIDGVSFPDGVVINKEITIDGNGTTISGNGTHRIFKVNAATTLNNITFVNGSAIEFGGAIYTIANLTVANSTFDNNSVAQNDANGGAIMAEAAAADVTLNIYNVTFTNNKVDNGGGAIGVAGVNGKTLTYNIYDSLFENNVANTTGTPNPASGGAIFSYGNAVGLINNTTFKGNDALTGDVSNGGAIKVQFGGTLTVANSTFINNKAGHAGGAISVQANDGMDNTLIVDNCTFFNNSADEGAAIASMQSVGKSTVTVKDSSFMLNTAEKGAAIYLDYLSDVKVENTKFMANKATNGSAIYALGDLEIDNGTFVFNTAEVGGAIYASAEYANVNVDIDNSAFMLNVASDAGGAIAVFATGSHELAYNINDSKFIRNGAYNNASDACVAGGAFYSEGKTKGGISSSIFSNNMANSTLYPNGGAIKIQFGGEAYIKDCNFTKNSAGLSGGAIDVQAKNGANCEVTVENCTFTNNTAQAGAAIASLQNHGNSTVNVISSRFNDNDAELVGGAIYSDKYSELFITSSNFTGNEGAFDDAIYNLGTLALQGNNVSNIIYNRGTIKSLVNATLNNNQTVTDKMLTEDVVVNATLTDDKGNAIYDPNFRITVDGNVVENITYNLSNKLYTANYTIKRSGEIVVSTSYSSPNLVINIGIYEVPKSNATIIVTTGQNNVFAYDENVTVFIGLYDNKTYVPISGIITVVIDSTPRTVEVINGSASFNVTGYEPGEHAIMGVFDGDNNYNGPVYNSTVFEVLYPNRILSIEAPVSIMEGEIAVINITVTDNKGNKEKGTVVLNLSGYEVVVIVDGNRSVEIGDLPVGIYTVNATLIEEGFNAAIVNDTELFSVIAKDDVFINITDVVITLGDTAVINASLFYITAGENLTITIVGKDSKVVTIDANGTAIAEFDGLAVGTYEIVVTYDGDRILNAATANATLTVNKRTPVFNITDANIKYREDAVFTIQTDNPGYYTLSINGTILGILEIDDEYNITIHTAGAPGVYDVVLSVDETENFTAGEAHATLTISKQATNLTIYNNGTDEDDVTYIGVFIKANGSYVYVTGNITIIVENETGIVLNITENITDDYYEYYDLGVLAPGKYNITAQYNGNEYYEASSADTVEYEAPKYVNYELPVTAENITYNQTEVITVILPNGTDKQDLIIIVNGDVYIGVDFIQEGNVVTLSIDGLNAGEYTVTAIFDDLVYDIKSNETSFTVAKANLTVAPKAIGEFVVDGNINVTFELPANVNASSVVVTVDGFPVIAELVNGTWIVPFDNLAAGDHIVTVSVVNDPNYNDATGEVMFTVSKVVPVITISDIEGIVGETVEVNVTIEGGDATGYIFYDGKLYIVENGTVAIPVVITTGGMQAIEVTYTGDDKYNNGTAVKEFNATKAASTTEINGTKLITTVDDAIVIVTVGPEGATGAIVVALDETIYNVYDIEDGIAIFTIPGLTAGNHSIVVKYTGDNNYNESVASMNITVNKTDVSDIITIEGKDAVYGESAYVYVSGLPEDATGNVTATIGNKTFTADVEYGIATVEITDLAAGLYELFAVSYSGDDKYNATSGMATVNITKAKSSVLIYDIEDVIYGADVEVNFTIENETEITVTVIGADGNNITEGITITPGEVIISGLKAGEYSIYIYNAGDENHTDSFDLATFKVNKATTKINITATGEFVVDGEVNITFTVPEDITDGTVSVCIDGEEVVGFTIINGTCTIPATFAAGSHTVIISLSGDTNYKDNASSKTFEIAKADPEASINATGVLPYGSDAIINVTLPEDATGVVVAEINGELYASYVENGTATIIIPDLVEGNYTATVTYYGDDKYQSVNTTLDIEVVNGLLIIAPDVFKYYHGPERFVIYTTDYAGNPIDGIDLQITINGVTYNRSSNNGKTSLALNLESGNYTVNVVFNGNSDYEAQNVTSQVEIESTIYAENVVKVFRNGTQYYALFLDTEGNPLADTQVTFNINGVFYNRTTNATGWAKLNINLEAGEYVLTATNPVTGESKGTNVTVLSQFVEHSALVKNYGDPTPYVVKIRTQDGSIAGAGEVVTFNINGVLYNRTTNSSGEAKLNINLMPGEFIITATYNGEDVSDIITIKPAN